MLRGLINELNEASFIVGGRTVDIERSIKGTECQHCYFHAHGCSCWHSQEGRIIRSKHPVYGNHEGDPGGGEPIVHENGQVTKKTEQSAKESKGKAHVKRVWRHQSLLPYMCR